jgi:hypothetical protein
MSSMAQLLTELRPQVSTTVLERGAIQRSLDSIAKLLAQLGKSKPGLNATYINGRDGLLNAANDGHLADGDDPTLRGAMTHIQ